MSRQSRNVPLLAKCLRHLVGIERVFERGGGGRPWIRQSGGPAAGAEGMRWMRAGALRPVGVSRSCLSAMYSSLSVLIGWNASLRLIYCAGWALIVTQRGDEHHER